MVPGAQLLWRALRAWGAILGWLAFFVLRVRRRHVVDAVTRAGIDRGTLVARQMYRSLGIALGEFLSLSMFPLRAPKGTVRLDPALLAECSGGAVAATAHTANWDLVACEVAQRLPLTVVTKRLSVGWLDRLWQQIRMRRGIELAEQGTALGAARQALGRGAVVAMMVDQAPERSRAVIVCRFLGEDARVDLAPALLAQRFRRPLVAAFPQRLSDGSYRLHFAGVLRPPERSSRDWAESAMAQVTAWLDEFVRRHPEQWLWMHRRWKGTPTAPVRRAARSEAGDAGLRVPRRQET